MCLRSKIILLKNGGALQVKTRERCFHLCLPGARPNRSIHKTPSTSKSLFYMSSRRYQVRENCFTHRTYVGDRRRRNIQLQVMRANKKLYFKHHSYFVWFKQFRSLLALFCPTSALVRSVRVICRYFAEFSALLSPVSCSSHVQLFIFFATPHRPLSCRVHSLASDPIHVSTPRSRAAQQSSRNGAGRHCFVLVETVASRQHCKDCNTHQCWTVCTCVQPLPRKGLRRKPSLSRNTLN